MKAPTVSQPWDWAICLSHKKIENRTWTTKHRGSLAMHAGQSYYLGNFEYIDAEMGFRAPDEVWCAGIVGVVEVVDVVSKSDDPWFSGPYGWVLLNARALDGRVAFKGRLGLLELGAALEGELMPRPELRSGRGRR